MIDVPPMTAAATDGSTETSTSETVAVLTSPATSRPATAASMADSAYRATSTCQIRAPGESRGDRVVADREEQPAEPRVAQAEQDGAAMGTNTIRLFGRKPRSSPCPSQMIASGSSVPALRTACW